MCVSRSSRPKVLCKKGVLIYFAKFSGKHQSQGIFLNKIEDLKLLLCRFHITKATVFTKKYLKYFELIGKHLVTMPKFLTLLKKYHQEYCFLQMMKKDPTYANALNDYNTHQHNFFCLHSHQIFTFTS